MFLGVADPLIHKVKAKKKVTWCHTDYDTLYPNKEMDCKTYEAVDHVVFVSDACRQKMARFYPALLDKTQVIFAFRRQASFLEKRRNKMSFAFVQFDECA